MFLSYKLLGWCAAVFCACEIIQLHYLVFYMLRFTNKFDLGPPNVVEVLNESAQAVKVNCNLLSKGLNVQSFLEIV